MLELDHLALAGSTLRDARDTAEKALGVSLNDGGEHAVFNTHNALLGLEDGLYFEAIATNPNAPQPTRPRWFDLDNFNGASRLTNWICRSTDLDASLQKLPVDAGEPVSLQRGDLRWRMAVPATGRLPFDNVFPALIQWDSTPTPSELLPTSGVTLLGLTVSHPDVSALSDMLSGILDDARVHFETGPAGLSATFETPNGIRQL
ncbi:MAG: VOC family protein [Paracoccaceae bacterium]